MYSYLFKYCSTTHTDPGETSIFSETTGTGKIWLLRQCINPKEQIWQNIIIITDCYEIIYLFYFVEKK